jgi:hypothetical protein
MHKPERTKQRTEKIIEAIKSRRMRWAVHAEVTGKLKVGATM